MPIIRKGANSRLIKKLAGACGVSLVLVCSVVGFLTICTHLLHGPARLDLHMPHHAAAAHLVPAMRGAGGATGGAVVPKVQAVPVPNLNLSPSETCLVESGVFNYHVSQRCLLKKKRSSTTYIHRAAPPPP